MGFNEEAGGTAVLKGDGRMGGQQIIALLHSHLAEHFEQRMVLADIGSGNQRDRAALS